VQALDPCSVSPQVADLLLENWIPKNRFILAQPLALGLISL
jgi:hypothetical protein